MGRVPAVRGGDEKGASSQTANEDMLSSKRTDHNLTDDTVRIETDTWQPQPPRPQREYYLLWRTGWSHPWRSEEIDSRNEAHARYFDLIERGYEAYLERRQGNYE